MSWFPFVVSATIAYGMVNFIYKISAQYGFSSLRMLNFQALTISILSGIILAFKSPGFENLNYLIALAAINSLFFTTGTTLKITSLKFIPVNVAMPLGKLKTVFVILIGLIFFKDEPSLIQGIGMAIALLTVFMLSKPSNAKMSASQKDVHLKGVFLILAAGAAIAISITAGKIASGKVDKFTYIWLSYTLVFCYTYISKRFIINKGKVFKEAPPKLLMLGASAGVLNLGGYYLILKAWELGPLSLVQGIFSLSMVITIIFAAIIYREKFTVRKVAAIILAIVAAMLIKSG